MYFSVALPGPSRVGKSPTQKTKMRNKMKKIWGKWGQIEEIFLSCPPGGERLATPLVLFVKIFDPKWCRILQRSMILMIWPIGTFYSSNVGYTEYDSILPVFQFVKSAFESRVVFDVYCIIFIFCDIFLCLVWLMTILCLIISINWTELLISLGCHIANLEILGHFFARFSSFNSSTYISLFTPFKNAF